MLLTAIAAIAAAPLVRAQAVDIRSINPAVNLSVPASAFNLATGEASVTSFSPAFRFRSGTTSARLIVTWGCTS